MHVFKSVLLESRPSIFPHSLVPTMSNTSSSEASLEFAEFAANGDYTFVSLFTLVLCEASE